MEHVWGKGGRANTATDPAGLDMFETTITLRPEREWRPGDIVSYELRMPVRKIAARKEVQDDLGKLCLERGPIVYCAEEKDNGPDVVPQSIRRDAVFQPEFRIDWLKGVVVLLERGNKERMLTAIPYYAWSNRGAGAMTVWLPETAQ